MRLGEFFRKHAKQRGVAIGHRFAENLREILNVQAPVRWTRSGRMVAARKATPFAPPRKVTGRLRRSVTEIPTVNGLKVVVYSPYAVPLEKSHRFAGWPHWFVSIVLKRMRLTGRNA